MEKLDKYLERHLFAVEMALQVFFVVGLLVGLIVVFGATLWFIGAS